MFQVIQRDYKSSSIGSGPQFYTKPPTALPANQTIEFDEGPKITVFIGKLMAFIQSPLDLNPHFRQHQWKDSRWNDQENYRCLRSCRELETSFHLWFLWIRVSSAFPHQLFIVNKFFFYSGPKSGARAVRLLSGYEVDGKKLVAKVDAKNQQLLDTAKDEENKKSDANNSRTSDAANEKKNDDLTIDRLNQILDEYKEELKAANSAESKLSRLWTESMLNVYFHSGQSAHPRSKQTMPSIEIEEGKRDLINKEIGRFRKNAEEEEAKKEKDKKKREIIEKERSERSERAEKKEKEKEKDKDKDKDKDRHTPSPEHERKSSRRRSRSRSRERNRERERERERDRERREADRRQREVEQREKEMRDRERFREEPKIMKNPKEIQRDKEMAEEEYERRRAQKKAREKHEDYLRRLE